MCLLSLQQGWYTNKVQTAHTSIQEDRNLSQPMPVLFRKSNQSIAVCMCGYYAESSEALMPGRKPKIQLLVQAVDSAGCRVSAIPVLISEEFVVTSPGLSCHASLCFSLVLPAAVYC